MRARSESRSRPGSWARSDRRRESPDEKQRERVGDNKDDESGYVHAVNSSGGVAAASRGLTGHSSHQTRRPDGLAPLAEGLGGRLERREHRVDIGIGMNDGHEELLVCLHDAMLEEQLGEARMQSAVVG